MYNNKQLLDEVFVIRTIINFEIRVTYYTFQVEKNQNKIQYLFYYRFQAEDNKHGSEKNSVGATCR